MRRPLAPSLRPDLSITSPFDRVMAKVGFKAASMPPYEVSCWDAKFKMDTLEDVSAFVGLSRLPQGKTERYPENPLVSAGGRKQHRTEFLQWGWGVEGNRQAIFEIGDSSFLTTFKFVRAEPYDKACPWQLDTLVIDTGQEDFYHIPCDEAEFVPMLDAVRTAVSNGVVALNAHDDWEGAEKLINPALRNVVRELDEISEKLSRQHAEEWFESERRDRQGRASPFTP